MCYAYPVEISSESDGTAAADALTTALSFYVEDNRPIPPATPPHGRAVMSVPALAAAKLALHEAMLGAGISDAQLACRLGLDERAVRRLRNPSHRDHIGTVERALRALGRRLEVNDVLS